MSDDIINVKQMNLLCYVPIGSTQSEIHYFKWGINGDLCHESGTKNAALFKPQEIERTIKLLQESKFPYKLQAQPVK